MTEFDKQIESIVRGFIIANDRKINEYQKKIELIKKGKTTLGKTRQKEKKTAIVDGEKMTMMGLGDDRYNGLIPIGLGAKETKERRIFEAELEKKKKAEIFINENFINDLNELNEKLKKILVSKDMTALKEAVKYLKWIDSADYNEKSRERIHAFIDGLESK